MKRHVYVSWSVVLKLMLNLSLYITICDVWCFVQCAMFCSVKDQIPTHQKSNVIYSIKFPGCGEDYVGKTDRCALKRLYEHSNSSYQPMSQHLQHCEKFLETMTLYQFSWYWYWRHYCQLRSSYCQSSFWKLKDPML